MTNEADHVTAGIELSTKPGKKKSSSYGQPWTIEEQVNGREREEEREGVGRDERENDEIDFPFV